ncbi:surface-adhesin E family protein [Polynucleobacter sp. AP-Kaivos-20-H2]|uniref:surface-adhesin E family protein n=1 Tax=Polynucleobacter sp. AP-Kaivos-20-H2 TaxID=2689104 RepID=UPI001C0AC18E|nr:surface-adhesin E family protein [Polynucleobacter sp. AP-Kaivos-20-H2]MBU3603339.1 hypothetical protein [Polynucleobacter sp. AP-Kaivos-20-H2]
MIKPIVLLWTILFASQAYADWTKVTANQDISVYIDAQAIQRNKSLVKVKVLVNEAKDLVVDKDQYPYQSFRTYIEYNCKKELQRALSTKWFSEPMGEGNIVYQDKHPYPFAPVVEGTLGLVVMKRVCKGA